MAPSKAPASWQDDDSDSSGASSTPAPAVARRGRFDDEEDDSDVLESWDAAEDSEVEREKAKKAAEEKAKAEAAAKASHKSKTQRIEEKREAAPLQRLREEEGLSSEEDDETEAEKRSRLRESEKASDLRHAEDLFGGVGGLSDNRTARPVTVLNGDDPTSAVELSSLKLFAPNTLQQFHRLRDTLVPLVGANSKKPQYASFMQELTKQLAKDMNSQQIKNLASALSTVSNEKMKEEKAADKSGKKTKAAKTKVTLSASRNVTERADTTAYDDGLADDDFM